jgi:hypothetical protein
MTLKEIKDRIKKAQSVEYTDEEFDELMELERNKPVKVYVDPIVPNFIEEELSCPVEYKSREEIEKMFEEQDTIIVVPPSVHKELKRQKANMKRYIKSKLIKIKDKNK